MYEEEFEMCFALTTDAFLDLLFLFISCGLSLQSLVFEGALQGRKFYDDLKEFCEDLNLDFQHKQENLLSIKFGVTTVYDRQKKLAELCRFVMHNVSCGIFPHQVVCGGARCIL